MAIIKVKTGGITADAVTDALIADDVVGTEHLTANEVDTTALGADAVTGAQLADNAVNSEHYTDGSIDTAHITDANVTQAKIADQAINEAKMQISNAPTNGYFLSAQSGNTGGLTWAEAGGGQWTHLLTSSASDSSSIAFSSTYITTTYLDYMIVLSGIKFATDNTHPYLLFSPDNGSNYSANGTHKNARAGVNAAGNDVNIGQTGSSGLYFSSSQAFGNATGEGFSGHVIVFDPLKQSGTTDMHTRMLAHTTSDDTGGDPVISITANKYSSTDAINNIKFQALSGNITSGKVSLYGRKIS